jgi:hypothetical protein
MLYPLKGRRHVAAGCWGVSGFYAAVLRSVNIPVKNGYVKLNEDVIHSRPYFPTFDRGLAHGDDVYTSILSPSGVVIPPSRFFYTSFEINAKLTNPTVDCVEGDCNTTGEQASYNFRKDHLQLAYDYMADYLLCQYAYFGGEYLNNSLRGPRISGTINEYVKPYFSESERATMVAAVENKVREIGEGDLEAGKSIVLERRDRFLMNK